MIKIDIWSDFVCPYCYIGKKQLDAAIKELGITDVRFEYHAFELHPDAPKRPGYSYMEDLLNKFPSEEYLRQLMLNPMEAEAKRLGFEMKFDNIEHQNTMDAHRLAKYAKFYNKDVEFFDACYKKVFGDNGFIADADTLIEVGKDLGLDEAQVRDVVNDEEKFKNLVLEDEARAEEMGIESVPFYIFNDKYAVSGAQGESSFKEILKKVNDEGGLIDLTNNANTCGPEGC